MMVDSRGLCVHDTRLCSCRYSGGQVEERVQGKCLPLAVSIQRLKVNCVPRVTIGFAGDEHSRLPSPVTGVLSGNFSNTPILTSLSKSALTCSLQCRGTGPLCDRPQGWLLDPHGAAPVIGGSGWCSQVLNVVLS